MRAEDGTALTQAATARGERRCQVCGEALALEQWWVTRYPEGVHTRCRDWGGEPFPFQRHLTLLARMRFTTEGEARELVIATEAWLLRFHRSWPEPGAKGVLSASRLLRRLRTRLAALGVAHKIVNQL